MKYSASNPPLVCMMTNSTCYKNTTKMRPVGVLWHSTGANNPYLKRYVQPDKDAPNRQELLDLIGINNYNSWNQIQVQAGLNCWIGKLADGTVTTLQTLPWDFKPWGCGTGPKGSCNNGWMQFEICEDSRTDKTYFETVYKEACEITAYYCKMYNLDPRGTVYYNGQYIPVIMSHAESYKRGVGSGHGDPEHWLGKYGKSLETIREDVAKLMGLPEAEEPKENEYRRGVAVKLSANFNSTEFDCDGSGCCNKTIVDPKLVDIVQKIRSRFGRATIIKSGYRCDTYNKKMLDEGNSYHAEGGAADIYINGVTPLEIAKYVESIGVKGIGLYSSYVHVDVRESKKYWEGDKGEECDSFINPAPAPAPTPTPAPSKPKTIGPGSIVSIIDGATYSNGKVISYAIRQREWEVNSINGQNALLGKSTDGKYNITSYVNLKYLALVEEEEEAAPVVPVEPAAPARPATPYLVRVTATLLNYRKGPGTNCAIVGTIKKGGVYTIVEEKDGWGKLKSGAGWIDLQFTELYN